MQNVQGCVHERDGFTPLMSSLRSVSMKEIVYIIK